MIGAQAQNAGKRAGRAGPTLDFLTSALRPALCAFFLVLLAACSREPPEAALRATIASMEAAAEASDTDALFDPIAEDFAGSEGMDRKAFRRYVTLMSMRYKSIGVNLGPMDVKLYGDRATVKFTAAVTGGPGLLPDQGQVYEVDTGWRLEGGDWKLISARWKDAL